MVTRALYLLLTTRIALHGNRKDRIKRASCTGNSVRPFNNTRSMTNDTNTTNESNTCNIQHEVSKCYIDI